MFARTHLNKQRGVIATVYLWIVAALIVAAMIGGTAHALYKAGYNSAKKDDAIAQKKIDDAAREKLDAANEQVRKAQENLNAVQSRMSDLQKELDDAKTSAAVLQSDLASGRKRMRVLIAASQSCGTQQGQSTTVGQVDNGTQVTADLDPGVAAGLVGITKRGDEAIARLNACIDKYEAVMQAVNNASR